MGCQLSTSPLPCSGRSAGRAAVGPGLFPGRTAGLWELDADLERVPTAHGSSVPQRWFDDHQPDGGLVDPVYTLVRESPQALAEAVNVPVESYFIDMDATAVLAELGLSEPGDGSPAETSFAERVAEYKRLCAGADIFWRDRDSTRAERSSPAPVRSAAARSAVLLRSEGHCENPRCTGDIEDLTDAGDPILEIDHIHDLARGGPDDPAQMIALCPNCHAIKTRGRGREGLHGQLVVTARRRHDALLEERRQE